MSKGKRIMPRKTARVRTVTLTQQEYNNMLTIIEEQTEQINGLIYQIDSCGCLNRFIAKHG